MKSGAPRQLGLEVAVWRKCDRDLGPAGAAANDLVGVALGHGVECRDEDDRDLRATSLIP